MKIPIFMSVLPSNVTLRLSNTLMMLSSMLSVLGILSLNLDFLNEQPKPESPITSSQVEKVKKVVTDHPAAYSITGIVQHHNKSQSKTVALPVVMVNQETKKEVPVQSNAEENHVTAPRGLGEGIFLIPLIGNETSMVTRVTQ